jgi:hypothetical protein
LSKILKRIGQQESRESKPGVRVQDARRWSLYVGSELTYNTKPDTPLGGRSWKEIYSKAGTENTVDA